MEEESEILSENESDFGSEAKTNEGYDRSDKSIDLRSSTSELSQKKPKIKKNGEVDKRSLNKQNVVKARQKRQDLIQKAKNMVSLTSVVESDSDSDDEVVLKTKAQIKQDVKDVVRTIKQKEETKLSTLEQKYNLLALRFEQLEKQNATLKKKAEKPRTKIVVESPRQTQAEEKNTKEEEKEKEKKDKLKDRLFKM